MRVRTKGAGIVFILISIFLPCYAAAQDILPPVCCSPDPPPPPPPGSSSLSATAATAEMPQVTVSDANLLQLGLTRGQFLDQVAAAMCPTPDGSYDLVIPVYTATTAADGTPIVQVTYLEIAKSEVAPEVIDALDLIFITNGQTCVAIVFTTDTSTAN